MNKYCVWAAGALVAASLSTAGWAGGSHGGAPMMFHPGGFHGGGHPGGFGGGFGGARHAMPPIGGTIHVRNGGSSFNGYGHTGTGFGARPGVGARVGGGFGHTNTALPHAAPGFAVRGGGAYGHTNTGFGARSYGNGGRIGFNRAGAGRLVRYGYGAYRPAYAYRPGYGYRYAYGAGGYGAGLSAAPAGSYAGYAGAGYAAGSAYDAGYAGAGNYGAGYAEPPLNGGYAEPPLNGGYGGGPLVIDGVRAPVVSCRCTMAPVVYRFGVGSYY